MQPGAAQIDVFISRKSEDAALAKELYDFLSAQGLNVFDSDEELRKRGNSDYRREIDNALDACKHLMVVGSALGNITSPWVEAEWGFFVNAKRAGDKQGNLVTVVTRGVDRKNLPPALRYYEVFDFDKANFQRIAAYVGGHPPQGTPAMPAGPVQSSLDSYIRKSVTAFSKPQFTTTPAGKISHLCSIPAGFTNLNWITPESANLVDKLSFNFSKPKYLATYSRAAAKALVWDSQKGEPVQEFSVGDALVDFYFDQSGRLVATTAEEVVQYEEQPTQTGLHGVEWREARRIKLPVLDGFNSPAIFQVTDSATGTEMALLVKESDYTPEKYQHGPCLVLLYNKYSGTEFERHIFMAGEDISHIKRIGKNAFVGFTRKNIHVRGSLLTPNGPYNQPVNDIVSAGYIDGCGLIGNVYSGLYFLDLNLDDQCSNFRPSESKAFRKIADGFFQLVAGGYDPGYRERRDLIAAAGRGDITFIGIVMKNTFWKKTYAAHKEEIVGLVWGGRSDEDDSLRRFGLDSTNPSFGEILSIPVLFFSRKLSTGCQYPAFLASAAKDGTIKLWSPENAGELACFQNASPIKPLFAWGEDNRFAYADRNGFIHVFNVAVKK